MDVALDYVIVSFIESFAFPVREATRKQIWWTAQKCKVEGYHVTIVILNNKAERINQDGVDIVFTDVNTFVRDSDSINILHCINGSIVPGLLHLRRVKAQQKLLTLTDGSMFWYDKLFLRKCIAFVLPIVFHKIYVYSNYQYNRLPNKKGVYIIKPILPSIKRKDVCKTDKPSVLYMGHITRMKGFDFIIPAMDRLLKSIPGLQFVICNNMISVEQSYIDRINNLRDRYPDQVILKGVVDPVEELSKAWVYIYPFIDDVGTMAFPLSLYEAQCCKTPFVACDVAANKEFFDSRYLIEPGSEEQLYDKIKQFIDERKD